MKDSVSRFCRRRVLDGVKPKFFSFAAALSCLVSVGAEEYAASVPANITSEQVWREVAKRNFAVLGFVTLGGEARSAGIIYAVRDRNIYIVTGRGSWKVRHIRSNPHVSLTVTIPRRIPLLPWIQIPQAAISFHGEASVRELADVPADIPLALMRGLKLQENEELMIRIRPVGQFLTYGVGVSLTTMRDPEAASGRASV